MKKYKHILTLLMVIGMLFGQMQYVWGAEQEWYDLQEIEPEQSLLESTGDIEITPYTRYIMGASVSLRRLSSNVLWMRTEVYCTESMSSITPSFTLQKKSGSSWVNVGKGTVSSSNDNSMYKAMEATGVSSGTYRCIADTKVVSKTGYTETVSVVSSTV